ncbi:MAG: patatin-like phospholipase family protein [Clostridia bacterium]|nr:patatin-like phospholipase family protein [Clostridia bacterium]
MGFFGWFGRIFGKSKNKTQQSPLKLGLALSGGGTRGVAYIGVFQALKEANIHFDYVAGTSVGSLMGAVYCSDLSIDQMINIAKNLRVKDIRTSKIKYMPSKTDKLRAVIREALDNKNFEDLRIPFTAVAVDIITGEEVRLTTGELDTAIAGSCAVPMIFNPVDRGQYRLYDGGLRNNIPADVVRDMGADVVIAFDLNPTRGYGTDSTKLLDLLKASLRILMKSNSVNGYVYSDYIVKMDLTQYSQFKLDNVEDMIRVGYQTTMAELPNILKAIGRDTPNNDIKRTAKKLKAIQRKNKRKAQKENTPIDTPATTNQDDEEELQKIFAD